MSGEKSGEVDLWGEPFPQRQETRGRKTHKRNPEIAETVAVLTASGLAVVDIALRANLSEPTLRKYYFRELEHGRALIKAVVIEGQLKKAKAGVVGAARFLREEFAHGDAKAAQRAVTQRSTETPAAKPEAIGKKAERQRAAEEVARSDDIFQTRRPPAPERKPN